VSFNFISRTRRFSIPTAATFNSHVRSFHFARRYVTVNTLECCNVPEVPIASAPPTVGDVTCLDYKRCEHRHKSTAGTIKCSFSSLYGRCREDLCCHGVNAHVIKDTDPQEPLLPWWGWALIVSSAAVRESVCFLTLF
jgi:hypothetical protein